MNSNKTGAGFPDVAAQAEGFIIVEGGMYRIWLLLFFPPIFAHSKMLYTYTYTYIQGFAYPVDGTSCSSPTFTGVVSLLNEIRLAAKKVLNC